VGNDYMGVNHTELSAFVNVFKIFNKKLKPAKYGPGNSY
jgi:hypothetical protein